VIDLIIHQIIEMRLGLAWLARLFHSDITDARIETALRSYTWLPQLPTINFQGTAAEHRSDG